MNQSSKEFNESRPFHDNDIFIQKRVERKGGRPLHETETDSDTVFKAIIAHVQAFLKRVEPNPKQKRPRHDIFKTRLVRGACKLPLDIAYMSSPRVIRITDYKSPEIDKYASSFKAVFDHVWSLMHSCHIVD